MADWPTVEAIKQSLGVTTAERDSVIASALAAAIEQVAVDLGYTDIAVDLASSPDDDVPELTAALSTDDSPAVITPSNSLSQAALILAVMTVKAPDAPYGVAAVFDLGGLLVAADHPTYTKMLGGQRQTFGVG